MLIIVCICCFRYCRCCSVVVVIIVVLFAFIIVVIVFVVIVVLVIVVSPIVVGVVVAVVFVTAVAITLYCYFYLARYPAHLDSALIRKPHTYTDIHKHHIYIFDVYILITFPGHTLHGGAVVRKREPSSGKRDARPPRAQGYNPSGGW